MTVAVVAELRTLVRRHDASIATDERELADLLEVRPWAERSATVVALRASIESRRRARDGVARLVAHLAREP